MPALPSDPARPNAVFYDRHLRTKVDGGSYNFNGENPWIELPLSQAEMRAGTGRPTTYGIYDGGGIVRNPVGGGFPDFVFPGLSFNAGATYQVEVTYDITDDYYSNRFWIYGATDDSQAAYDSSPFNELYNNEQNVDGVATYSFTIGPGQSNWGSNVPSYMSPIFESDRYGRLIRLRYRVAAAGSTSTNFIAPGMDWSTAIPIHDNEAAEYVSNELAVVRESEQGMYRPVYWIWTPVQSGYYSIDSMMSFADIDPKTYLTDVAVTLYRPFNGSYHPYFGPSGSDGQAVVNVVADQTYYVVLNWWSDPGDEYPAHVSARISTPSVTTDWIEPDSVTVIFSAPDQDRAPLDPAQAGGVAIYSDATSTPLPAGESPIGGFSYDIGANTIIQGGYGQEYIDYLWEWIHLGLGLSVSYATFDGDGNTVHASSYPAPAPTGDEVVTTVGSFGRNPYSWYVDAAASAGESGAFSPSLFGERGRGGGDMFILSEMEKLAMRLTHGIPTSAPNFQWEQTTHLVRYSTGETADETRPFGTVTSLETLVSTPSDEASTGGSAHVRTTVQNPVGSPFEVRQAQFLEDGDRDFTFSGGITSWQDDSDLLPTMRATDAPLIVAGLPREIDSSSAPFVAPINPGESVSFLLDRFAVAFKVQVIPPHYRYTPLPTIPDLTPTLPDPAQAAGEAGPVQVHFVQPM